MSAIALGSLRFRITFDSMRVPGLSAIIRTRQGETCGARALTLASGLSGEGESRVTRAPGRPATPERYIPAKSVRFASVTASHTSSAYARSNGRPSRSLGVTSSIGLSR